MIELITEGGGKVSVNCKSITAVRSRDGNTSSVYLVGGNYWDVVQGYGEVTRMIREEIKELNKQRYVGMALNGLITKYAHTYPDSKRMLINPSGCAAACIDFSEYLIKALEKREEQARNPKKKDDN